MMGYALFHSKCFGCDRLMSYNPMTVPSIRATNGMPDPGGVREPICQECVDKANVVRAENGLPEIIVRPGAYEAIEESLLDYS